MERDNFLNMITEIGKLEDMTEVRTKLVELSDNATKLYDDIESNKSTIDTLNQTLESNKNEIKKLQENNMALFLRVGENKSQAQVQEGSTGLKDSENHKRSFEDLFKDKESDK